MRNLNSINEGIQKKNGAALLGNTVKLVYGLFLCEKIIKAGASINYKKKHLAYISKFSNVLNKNNYKNLKVGLNGLFHTLNYKKLNLNVNWGNGRKVFIGFSSLIINRFQKYIARGLLYGNAIVFFKNKESLGYFSNLKAYYSLYERRYGLWFRYKQQIMDYTDFLQKKNIKSIYQKGNNKFLKKYKIISLGDGSILDDHLFMGVKSFQSFFLKISKKSNFFFKIPEVWGRQLSQANKFSIRSKYLASRSLRKKYKTTKSHIEIASNSKKENVNIQRYIGDMHYEKLYRKLLKKSTWILNLKKQKYLNSKLYNNVRVDFLINAEKVRMRKNYNNYFFNNKKKLEGFSKFFFDKNTYRNQLEYESANKKLLFKAEDYFKTVRVTDFVDVTLKNPISLKKSSDISKNFLIKDNKIGLKEFKIQKEQNLNTKFFSLKECGVQNISGKVFNRVRGGDSLKKIILNRKIGRPLNGQLGIVGTKNHKNESILTYSEMFNKFSKKNLISLVGTINSINGVYSVFGETVIKTRSHELIAGIRNKKWIPFIKKSKKLNYIKQKHIMAYIQKRIRTSNRRFKKRMKKKEKRSGQTLNPKYRNKLRMRVLKYRIKKKKAEFIKKKRVIRLGRLVKKTKWTVTFLKRFRYQIRLRNRTITSKKVNNFNSYYSEVMRERIMLLFVAKGEIKRLKNLAKKNRLGRGIKGNVGGQLRKNKILKNFNLIKLWKVGEYYGSAITSLKLKKNIKKTYLMRLKSEQFFGRVRGNFKRINRKIRQLLKKKTKKNASQRWALKRIARIGVSRLRKKRILAKRTKKYRRIHITKDIIRKLRRERIVRRQGRRIARYIRISRIVKKGETNLRGGVKMKKLKEKEKKNHKNNILSIKMWQMFSSTKPWKRKFWKRQKVKFALLFKKKSPKEPVKIFKNKEVKKLQNSKFKLKTMIRVRRFKYSFRKKSTTVGINNFELIRKNKNYEYIKSHGNCIQNYKNRVTLREYYKECLNPNTYVKKTQQKIKSSKLGVGRANFKKRKFMMQTLGAIKKKRKAMSLYNRVGESKNFYNRGISSVRLLKINGYRTFLSKKWKVIETKYMHKVDKNLKNLKLNKILNLLNSISRNSKNRMITKYRLKKKLKKKRSLKLIGGDKKIKKKRIVLSNKKKKKLRRIIFNRSWESLFYRGKDPKSIPSWRLFYYSIRKKMNPFFKKRDTNNMLGNLKRTINRDLRFVVLSNPSKLDYNLGRKLICSNLKIKGIKSKKKPANLWKFMLLRGILKSQLAMKSLKIRGEKKLFLFSKKINKKNQILSLGGVELLHFSLKKYLVHKLKSGIRDTKLLKINSTYKFFSIRNTTQTYKELKLTPILLYVKAIISKNNQKTTGVIYSQKIEFAKKVKLKAYKVLKKVIKTKLKAYKRYMRGLYNKGYVVSLYKKVFKMKRRRFKKSLKWRRGHFKVSSLKRPSKGIGISKRRKRLIKNFKKFSKLPKSHFLNKIPVYYYYWNAIRLKKLRKYSKFLNLNSFRKNIKSDKLNTKFQDLGYRYNFFKNNKKIIKTTDNIYKKHYRFWKKKYKKKMKYMKVTKCPRRLKQKLFKRVPLRIGEKAKRVLNKFRPGKVYFKKKQRFVNTSKKAFRLRKRLYVIRRKLKKRNKVFKRRLKSKFYYSSRFKYTGPKKLKIKLNLIRKNNVHINNMAHILPSNMPRFFVFFWKALTKGKKSKYRSRWIFKNKFISGNYFRKSRLSDRVTHFKELTKKFKQFSKKYFPKYWYRIRRRKFPLKSQKKDWSVKISKLDNRKYHRGVKLYTFYDSSNAHYWYVNSKFKNRFRMFIVNKHNNLKKRYHVYNNIGGQPEYEMFIKKKITSKNIKWKVVKQFRKISKKINILPLFTPSTFSKMKIKIFKVENRDNFQKMNHYVGKTYSLAFKGVLSNFEKLANSWGKKLKNFENIQNWKSRPVVRTYSVENSGIGSIYVSNSLTGCTTTIILENFLKSYKIFQKNLNAKVIEGAYFSVTRDIFKSFGINSQLLVGYYNGFSKRLYENNYRFLRGRLGYCFFKKDINVTKLFESNLRLKDLSTASTHFSRSNIELKVLFSKLNLRNQSNYVKNLKNLKIRYLKNSNMGVRLYQFSVNSAFAKVCGIY